MQVTTEILVIYNIGPSRADYPLDVRVPGQSTLCRNAWDALIYCNGVEVGLQVYGKRSRTLWAPGTREIV